MKKAKKIKIWKILKILNKSRFFKEYLEFLAAKHHRQIINYKIRKIRTIKIL